MREKLNGLWLTLAAFPVLSLGIALQLKAGIGQSMFNAFALILSDLSGLQIGHMINGLNGLFFLTFILLRKNGIKLLDLFQFAAVLINGILVNFFLYDVLTNIHIENYVFKLMLFLLGVCLASLSLGAILAMQLIKFPLEGLSIQISEAIHKSLAYVRMRFDVLFLVSTVVLSLLFDRPLYIREGTALSFLLLSKLLGLSYNYFMKIYGGISNAEPITRLND